MSLDEITMDRDMKGGNSNCDGGHIDRRTGIQFGTCLASKQWR